jgi:hypothetical protein
LGDHQTQDQLGHPLKQGSNMKKLSLAAALLGAVVSYISATNPASAVLHGVCAGCVGQNIGGNDVTVLGPGGVTGFGFSSSPAGATGDLQLKILIPNTFTLQQVSTFAEQVSVTGAGAGGTGDIVLFNGGQQFTGGFLEEFLGNFNTSPKNPLGAFIDATNAVLATDATGYFVLTADMGQLTLGGQNDPFSAFSLDPAVFAQGGLILANLFTAAGDVISTAQSGALFFNRPSGGPFSVTPVPGPIAGAGIPGLIACFSLLGFRTWRRRRNMRTA